MGRKKDEIPSIRLRMDINVKPGTDERVDKALAWYRSLPNRKRATVAWGLLVAVVNGEVAGVAVRASGEFDFAAAEQSMDDLLAEFAG